MDGSHLLLGGWKRKSALYLRLTLVCLLEWYGVSRSEAEVLMAFASNAAVETKTITLLLIELGESAIYDLTVTAKNLSTIQPTIVQTLNC